MNLFIETHFFHIPDARETAFLASRYLMWRISIAACLQGKIKWYIGETGGEFCGHQWAGGMAETCRGG